MGSRENMAGIMTATGLYKLDGSSPADWELDAYNEGLLAIRSEIEALLDELFVMTAPPERLSQWEELFYCQSRGGAIEDRRRGIARALGFYPGPMNGGAIKELLDIAGVRGEVIKAGGFLGVTKREAERLLDRILPAHISWELIEVG